MSYKSDLIFGEESSLNDNERCLIRENVYTTYLLVSLISIPILGSPKNYFKIREKGAGGGCSQKKKKTTKGVLRKSHLIFAYYCLWIKFNFQKCNWQIYASCQDETQELNLHSYLKEKQKNKIRKVYVKI